MNVFKTSYLAFFMATGLVIGVFFLLMSVYFGNNPLNRSLQSFPKYAIAFPQGWAFFTKTAEDPIVYFASVRDEVKVLNLRSMSSDYRFGASRHNRILIIEIQNISNASIEKGLKPISLKSSASLEKVLATIDIASTHFVDVNVKRKAAPDFKGKFFLVVEERLPWPLLHLDRQYPSTYSIFPLNVIQE